MHKIKKLIAANKGFLIFLFGMLAIRSAVADWYYQPRFERFGAGL